MDAALKTAVSQALKTIEVKFDLSPADDERNDRIEFLRLREFRKMGLMRPLVARVALLTSVGWKRTAIAEALDVSRVTLNNWLRDHTSGEDTFRAYGPDALEGDPDSDVTDQVTAPLVNKLTKTNAEKLGGVRYEHDKFVVPAGFVRPLSALWRVAYRARGPELTNDPEVAAAGDALDVLVSVLLRRGVTNLAIAEAADVTHRAVLDRMNRARQRGLVLSCGRDDDACESFFGEDVVRQLYGMAGGYDESAVDTKMWIDSSECASFDGALAVTPVRLTSARPSKYWLQTMVDTEAEGRPAVVMPVRGEKHRDWHSRLRCSRHDCSDDVTKTRTARSELPLAAMLGRMNEESGTARAIAATLRNVPMFVPTSLLYTEAVESTGLLPVAPSEAVSHVPAALWEKYFQPFPTVLKCFFDPDDIESNFEPTAKHKPDAKTRRH